MFRWILFSVIILSSCQLVDQTSEIKVSSPDGRIVVELALDQGFPFYSVDVDGEALIQSSGLGFEFRGQTALVGPFKVSHIEKKELQESWEPVWGQEDSIHSHSHMASITLVETQGDKRRWSLHFRVFNDGVAFRYEIPEQPGQDSLFITKELTEFSFANDGPAWWIPGSHAFDTYEKLHIKSLLSEVDSANTPLTFVTENGLHVSLHEANLTNYAGMTLKRSAEETLLFKSELVPWPDGDKVKTVVPMLSPWRTITIGHSGADLLRSRMILNLNEPNKLTDVSWIKPMKYIGIWWGMHINKYTWVQGPKHGATTANTKAYIDFAAENNIQGVLVEGWNQGWERWGQADALQLTQPYDDFDVIYLTQYARDKGITFIGHHETTANVTSYERQLDTAYAFYSNLGISAIKTGYVGPIKPEGQYHYGQWMVEHFRKVVELAASYQITLDVHEPIKATGIARTWPNMMTREGARGLEYNAWSEGNPPDHTTILPFTRLLAGPMDYTPGIFDITFDRYKPDNRVQTTLTKQLALMVVLYSPLQMAADLPENYEDHPAFQFVRDLVTDWDETRILQAEIGEEVAIARRQDNSWFIGAITNQRSRNLDIPLADLIQADMIAECYVDGPGAHWESNPTSIHIGSYLATPADTLKASLAAGGGLAIHLRAPTKADQNLPLISQLKQNQN